MALVQSRRTHNNAACVLANKQFKNGAQFGAWLGLIPKQKPGGGKNNLGGLRMLLIRGTQSAVTNGHKRDDPISKLVHQLPEKSGWQNAVEARANKNARILWCAQCERKMFGVTLT